MHEITTARLYLRPMAKDDFETDYAMVSSDPRVTWNHKAQSRDQAQITLDKRLRHWTDHGFGMYAVIERVTQQLIGHGGLQRLEETSDVELGYYLGWPAWGRGFCDRAKPGGVAVWFRATPCSTHCCRGAPRK
jgi:ribosomal-protein-alanine N-acetyltransferase